MISNQSAPSSAAADTAYALGLGLAARSRQHGERDVGGSDTARHLLSTTTASQPRGSAAAPAVLLVTPAAQEGHQDGDQHRAQASVAASSAAPSMDSQRRQPVLSLVRAVAPATASASVLDPFVQRWTVMSRVEDVSPEERDRRHGGAGQGERQRAEFCTMAVQLAAPDHNPDAELAARAAAN